MKVPDFIVSPERLAQKLARQEALNAAAKGEARATEHEEGPEDPPAASADPQESPSTPEEPASSTEDPPAPTSISGTAKAHAKGKPRRR